MKDTLLLILKFISILLLVFFAISLLGGELKKDYGYKEQSDYEYPLSGIDNILVDDDYEYCFSQYFQAVNAYDTEGNFQFSITVSDREKGKGKRKYVFLE